MGAAAAAVALATTGMFSGAVLFISAIELPAAMKYNYSSFLNYFRHMYPRGFMMQGVFAVSSICSSFISAAKSPDQQTKQLWQLAGSLMFAVFPYTMIVLMPTTRKIMRQEEKDPAAQKVLLRKWAKLHHGRTVLSLSAFAAMLAAVVTRMEQHL